MSSPSPAGVKMLGFEEEVPVSRLLPAPYNPRVIDREELDRLKASLREHGFLDPIIARQSDGLVLGGHQRLRAVVEEGGAVVPVRWIECGDLEAKAVNVALNNPRLQGRYDEKALGVILEELRAHGKDVLSGFDGGEVDRIIAEAKGQRPGLTDPDHIPAPPDSATTKPGDLWILGEHRLICGRSESVADMDRLMAGGVVHLLNTDPPYNVRVEPRSNNAIAAGLSSFPQGLRGYRLGTRDAAADLARHPEKSKATHRKLRAKDRPLENDFLPPKEFEALLQGWFRNAARVMEPGRGFYVWGGYSNISNYPVALAGAGLYFAQCIVWVKKHPVMTRKDFMGNHEWCFYGWKEGAAHYFDPRVKNMPDVWEDVPDFCCIEWCEKRAHEALPGEATDLWPIKKVTPQLMIHLTEKPVELAARAIRLSSRPGETVLDQFGGSGSTLIAAEQLGRRARLVEADPLYCDVIVKRWEEFTGGKAVLEDPGLPVPAPAAMPAVKSRKARRQQEAADRSAPPEAGPTRAEKSRKGRRRDGGDEASKGGEAPPPDEASNGARGQG